MFKLEGDVTHDRCIVVHKQSLRLNLAKALEEVAKPETNTNDFLYKVLFSFVFTAGGILIGSGFS